MNYSQKFMEALGTGEVLVRSIWKNTNSTKGQYSVQFMQQIKNPSDSNSNAAVALLQGYQAGQRVTAISSVSAEVIKSKGIDKLLGEGTTYFCNSDRVFTDKAMFGSEANFDIQVVENTERNPFSSTQEPKINPTTGEILTKDGQPIYRHTSIVMKGQAVNQFLTHDIEGVVDTSTVAQGVRNEMTEEVGG